MNLMQQTDHVTQTMTGNVLTMTLGVPPAHPLSLAMINALLGAVRNAQAAPDVHSVLLHGPGRIFCAGHDMKEVARHRDDADQGLAYLHTLFDACADLMQAIATSPKPVIAVTEGLATAGGLQLLAACDLAFAAPTARFCLPGVSNGGFCTTPAVAVGRCIARKHVMEMALSGDTFDADWALSVGLINRILPETDLLPHAMDFAQRLAARHQPAVALGKQTLHEQLEMPLAQAYAHAITAMISHFMDPVRIARDKARWGGDRKT
jgi:enoyl-CoA hydratase/carnithine racemase